MADEIPKDAPNREELLKAVQNAQSAQKAQSLANDLRSKAYAMTDPDKRETILREAFDKEMEANGYSKMAKRMQSGPWQGFGFGGGIGAATGLGIGAGLGTLLGGITAIPTTGLGMLIGTGVGAVHGPWITLGGKKQKFEDADPDEVVDAIERNKTTQDEPKPQQNDQDTNLKPLEAESQQEEQKPKRKPPKLEVRNKSTQVQEDTKKPEEESSKPRRKPKKLEVRSGKSNPDPEGEQ